MLALPNFLSADELLTAELLVNGTFGGLDKHQLVALISCLVPVDRTNVSLWPSRKACSPERLVMDEGHNLNSDWEAVPACTRRRR